MTPQEVTVADNVMLPFVTLVKVGVVLVEVFGVTIPVGDTFQANVALQGNPVIE